MTSIGKVLIGDNYPIRIMGIINTSPESFYKESIKTSTEEIAGTASEMQNSGADIIDIGSMSTAPYLQTIIPIEEEIKRMKQAINIVRKSCNYQFQSILQDQWWLKRLSPLVLMLSMILLD